MCTRLLEAVPPLRRRRRAVACLLAAVWLAQAAIVAGHGLRAWADEPPAVPAAPPPGGEAPAEADPLAAEMAPLLAAVEGVAREADVRALMRHAGLAEQRFALAAAQRLAHAGGPYAARALRTLAASPHRGVRLVALTGIGQAGLRMRGTGVDDRELARAATGDDPELQRAAIESLGRVGQAEDVETLVAAFSSDHGPVALAAERALAGLTGSMQEGVAGRWASWWQRNREPLQREVELALDALQEAAGASADDEEGAQALAAQEEQAWSLIERDAWLLLPGVATRAREWMGDGEAPVRVRGYRLARALRTVELAEPLRRAQRSGERDPEAAAALGRALEAYGMVGMEKKDR